MKSKLSMVFNTLVFKIVFQLNLMCSLISIFPQLLRRKMNIIQTIVIKVSILSDHCDIFNDDIFPVSCAKKDNICNLKKTVSLPYQIKHVNPIK